jgi:hypothetical protein
MTLLFRLVEWDNDGLVVNWPYWPLVFLLDFVLILFYILLDLFLFLTLLSFDIGISWILLKWWWRRFRIWRIYGGSEETLPELALEYSTKKITLWRKIRKKKVWANVKRNLFIATRQVINFLRFLVGLPPLPEGLPDSEDDDDACADKADIKRLEGLLKQMDKKLNARGNT